MRPQYEFSYKMYCAEGREVKRPANIQQPKTDEIPADVRTYVTSGLVYCVVFTELMLVWWVTY